MKKTLILLLALLPVAAFSSCEKVDDHPDDHLAGMPPQYIGLGEIAQVLSSLPITDEQLQEVHDAVSSSSGNGYDEEYTMTHLFSAPGTGVGEGLTKSAAKYTVPLRNMIEDKLRSLSAGGTKSGEENLCPTLERLGVDVFLKSLTESDIQIYWPFSESWDGSTMPVITFDPEDGTETNTGYRLYIDDDGFRRVEEVVVDEAMAAENPVWVVNRNDDASYISLELLRRMNPDWGEGGGNIVIRPMSAAAQTTRSSPVKSLVLKDFTMRRNYDSWFAGASEFFVKIGAVEDFTASTEAELRLYNPSVTDFMVVVKRSKVGVPQPFNAMLVSEWTDQMTNCAFMITEDDGGTRTEWKCTALVRIASKSYGVEMSLPFNTRDDIVWRGQLSKHWLEANSGKTGHFGDIDLTFEMVEY